MISLLMTVKVMGCVVVGVLDITKEAFMVGKRFSMVANLMIKQLNISVEKMFALLQHIILPLLPPLLHVPHPHQLHLWIHKLFPFQTRRSTFTLITSLGMAAKDMPKIITLSLLLSKINKKMMLFLFIWKIITFRAMFGWVVIKPVLKMSLLVIGHG